MCHPATLLSAPTTKSRLKTKSIPHCYIAQCKQKYSLLLSLCRALWCIFGLKCILARWNKRMNSDNQTVVQYKQPIKIKKPLECLCCFLAALVKEMMVPFSCPNHGWKHCKQQIKSRFSAFSTRGRRSSKVRGRYRASKHQKTACSRSMAGGEEHVS